MPVEWSDIFVELKRSIIDLLDYESRCNLRICSKNEKAIVDSTKFRVSTLKMKEIRSEMDPSKTILRVDIDTFTMWFVGKQNITKVDRGWNGELIPEWSNLLQEDPLKVAEKFIDEKIADKGLIIANTVELSSTSLLPMSHWKLKCQNLALLDVVNSDEWLGQSEPKFKKLEVAVWGQNDIDHLPHIISTSDSLRLCSQTDITDETVRKIKATDMNIVGVNLTLNTLKFTLARFLKYGKRKDEMHFEVMTPSLISEPRQLIPEGVRIRKSDIRSDDDALETFCCKIVGGFTNVHGVQDVRELKCFSFGNVLNISCTLWEKPQAFLTLYPFTNY